MEALNSIRLAEWLTMLAIVSGPIAAVLVTLYRDDRKQRLDRQHGIFKTLMATRASGLSPHHVEALNRIDVEFDPRKQKDKPVVEAWHSYLDVLSQTSLPEEQWVQRRVDALVRLLRVMAARLNYDFEETHIRKSSYYPIAFGDYDQDARATMKGVRQLLEGNRVLPVVVMYPPATPTQNE
jgi:hypothetical protein